MKAALVNSDVQTYSAAKKCMNLTCKQLHKIISSYINDSIKLYLMSLCCKIMLLLNIVQHQIVQLLIPLKTLKSRVDLNVPVANRCIVLTDACNMRMK